MATLIQPGFQKRRRRNRRETVEFINRCFCLYYLVLKKKKKKKKGGGIKKAGSAKVQYPDYLALKRFPLHCQVVSGSVLQ